MSTHFYELKIRQVVKETPDCVSVSFEIPENLKSIFQFKEGQNITVKKMINGQELRRSYSICNAPYENEIKVAIKKIKGGLFSSFANDELKNNDTLEIMPPVGKFNSRFGNNKNYLAIAAGSGITPVLSIIKHTLHEQSDSKVTLVYGNKNRTGIVFFEELESLKNKYINRFNFINILSREKTDAEINYGRIDADKLNALGRTINYTSFDAVYICGPESMIFSSSEFLQQKGVDKNKIHFELFTTPGQKNKNTENKDDADSDTGPKSNITIKLDGRSFDFDLSYNGASILDAALKQGADLPFACKGGVCCTCRAKLISGSVKMDVNYALEQEEVEQGFILTCQSHPTTENVVIDFDVK